jgi:hypothetical protein
MTTAVSAPTKLDRYVVIHVATTCDEHGVYVTKDSAEVIEVGWILLDSKTCDEVIDSDPETGKQPDNCLTAASRKCACQASQHTNYPSMQ